MSHRFSKNAGFSSLEVKCLSLFSIFLIVVMMISFFLYWYVTESVVAQRNPDTARLLADRAMLIKHWRKLEAKEEFLWIVDELTEKLSEQKYEWEMISPQTPESRQDEYVRSLMESYESNPKQILDPIGVLEEDTYYYYKPIFAEATCLRLCHSQLDTVKRLRPSDNEPATKPLEEGDLMSVLCVKIPNGPTQQTINWSWNMLLSVVVITVVMGIVAFYITIRYVIIRPLRHLREVSTAITHGNMDLRAELHTGDEFESLGQVFNRMLRGLINSQKELRRTNQTLDKKIEELGQVNLQLREMNRIKSDFLATMSHELRTPLNSILGFSDVLESIDSLDERQKRYVTHIQKSGRMLLGMINDILDLAKMESGRMEIRLVDFSIEQVVSAQCDMARPLAEKKTISLSHEVPPGLPLVHLDQNRVQQILNNLLSNAIKFTPEGGVVKVVVTPENTDEHGDVVPETSRLLIQVSDTGVGMTEEDIQTIFEKFRQGSSATGGDMMTREHSGTGLGLSIVREICKLLHGEIRVESVPGAGSTFSVRLPWRMVEKPTQEEFYF
ncbi:MAG: ATP-binding protein [Planctomycetia bacterium]|nr:ATP-binding protein [Planctomycetia bacterium]